MLLIFFTIALSEYVQVKVGVFWVEFIKLKQQGPEFSPYGFFILDVVLWVGDVRESGAGRLVDEKYISKRVPA